MTPTPPLRVLAVTSWNTACGIAAYCEMLKEASAPFGVDLIPDAEALDPQHFMQVDRVLPDVLWLNYHRGLLSRWTPEVLRDIRKANPKVPVVITFHDTYGEREPDALSVALHDLADAFIVHEPCVGLVKQVLIRQGVLPAALVPVYPCRADGRPFGAPQQPILGTMGFSFPWKNFARLAEVTQEAGWAYLVVSNNATDAEKVAWEATNPNCLVLRGFKDAQQIVALLAGCDATAFAYECANSGTSGAIRLGLAARKPLIAFEGCRQFRDLQDMVDIGARAVWTIRWVKDFSALQGSLLSVPIQRLDPGIAYLAHRDRWPLQAARYAAIFHAVASR